MQGSQVRVNPGQGTRSHMPQLKKKQSSIEILGKRFLGRENSMCRGPEAGTSFSRVGTAWVSSRVSEAEKDRRWSWKLLCIKYIKKDLLCNTGRCTQCLVITSNGKESIDVYLYIWVTLLYWREHSYCKLTTLQLKKIFFKENKRKGDTLLLWLSTLFWMSILWNQSENSRIGLVFL